MEKCNVPDKERAKVEQFLGTIPQFPFDALAARESARVRGFLESRGIMIGPYDILLAGQALAGGLCLVSANTTEFSRVPGLVVENWRERAAPAGEAV